MKQSAYCLFATLLGSCGIAWSENLNVVDPFVVSGFQLPEATIELTEARIALASGGRKSSDPPPAIATIISRVRRHLHGELQDFRDIPVDLNGASSLVRKVCEAIREVPAGQTTTYAGLAAALGQPFLARAIGRALGKNPIPLIIPCHRVLAAHGKPGGFSAYGGRATKAKLLAIEGVVVNLCLELTAGA